MADLIDRTELRNAMRDNGLYYTAVRQIIEAAPCVDDTAAALIRTMGADLDRLGKLTVSLRLANSVLLKENQELKERLKER
jgi:NADH:ubiquinone oxidoreductase subunit D